jgi:hypothetical protein
MSNCFWRSDVMGRRLSENRDRREKVEKRGRTCVRPRRIARLFDEESGSPFEYELVRMLYTQMRERLIAK